MATNVKNYKEYSVELSTNPSIPSKDKQFDFDKNKLQNWILTYGSGCEDAIIATGNQIRRITFSDFLGGLKHCIEQLPKPLLPKSVVLVSEHKSNKWVAEIALKYFPKFFSHTTSFLSLGHEDASDFVASLHSIPEKKWPKDMVLFDDAGFSGNQMKRHVTAIVEKMAKAEADGNIYVVIPFVTNVAMNALQNIVLPENIKLNIVTSQIIPTLKESISKEDFNTLNGVCGGVLEKIGVEGGVEDAGIATAYFDHKIPNNQSFIFSLIARDAMPKIKPPYL